MLGPPGMAWGAQKDTGQWPGAHSVPQESCWTQIQSTATQKTLLLGQIKLAVLNLFQQTTAQLRIPTDRAQEDTKAQLDMVSTTLSPGQWGGAGDTRGHLHPWIAVASVSHLHRCCSACRPCQTSVPLAHTHNTTGVPGCFGARNSPGDTCLLLGLGRSCQGQHGATGPLWMKVIPASLETPCQEAIWTAVAQSHGWHHTQAGPGHS